MARREQASPELPLAALGRLGNVGDEAELSFRRLCASSARTVLAELWEDEVGDLCGARWKPRRGARIARAGATNSEIVLGGERVKVRRPRIRSRAGREVELKSYRLAADRDLLDRPTLETLALALTAGGEPAPGSGDGLQARFLTRLHDRLEGELARPRRESFACVVVGAIAFSTHFVLVAVGMAPGRARRVLALRAGSPDNREAAAAVFGSLAPATIGDVPELIVIGDSDGLRDGLSECGDLAGTKVHRCPIERRRRVLGLLPAEAQPWVRSALVDAYAKTDGKVALRELEEVVRQLEASEPQAAAVLASGLNETLTVHELGAAGAAAERRRRPTAPTART